MGEQSEKSLTVDHTDREESHMKQQRRATSLSAVLDKGKVKF